MQKRHHKKHRPSESIDPTQPREEQIDVQGPVKKLQPDGMSHREVLFPFGAWGAQEAPPWGLMGVKPPCPAFPPQPHDSCCSIPCGPYLVEFRVGGAVPCMAHVGRGPQVQQPAHSLWLHPHVEQRNLYALCPGWKAREGGGQWGGGREEGGVGKVGCWKLMTSVSIACLDSS